MFLLTKIEIENFNDEGTKGRPIGTKARYESYKGLLVSMRQLANYTS